jgi:hypothetical protein
MISFDEALAIIGSAARPLDTEIVALADTNVLVRQAANSPALAEGRLVSVLPL